MHTNNWPSAAAVKLSLSLIEAYESLEFLVFSIDSNKGPIHNFFPYSSLLREDAKF